MLCVIVSLKVKRSITAVTETHKNEKLKNKATKSMKNKKQIKKKWERFTTLKNVC